MRKINRIALKSLPGLFFVTLILLLADSCQKTNDLPAVMPDEHLQTENRSRDLKDFLQVNLVANNDQYGAAHVDPTLMNGWGIAFSSNGTAWVNSQAGHVSDVYNREGVLAIPPVNIPSPGADEGGNPTGIVFSGSATDFKIPSGNGTPDAAARFIFVGVDGVVSAWNGTRGTHAFRKFDHSATSVYTGLTLALRDSATFLYAADFRSRKIVVWDANWNPVHLPFRDFRLPHGYSPFNIQNVGGLLYVMYAKVGSDGEEETGVGKGLVDIYTPNGIFVKRFATGDKLNAPWGVAMAPASFFPQDMDEEDDDNDRHDNHGHEARPAILVGNFGDGHINAYSLHGKFLGQLRKNKHTLIIEGLWAIMFPPSTSTIDPNRLYFAAGPNDEKDGLFGYIIKDSTSHESHHGDN